MSALDIQIGGEHYKNAKIQPIQYIEANGLGFLEGCVVKRITRHDKPTGKGRQDIQKAIHELQLLLEFRYPEQPADAAGLSTLEQRAAVYAALCSAQGATQAEAVRRALDVCNQRTTPVSPAEDVYAEFAALLSDRKISDGFTLAAQNLVCAECGYPTDAAGTHYATCSQLTAPEEYKAEAQVAFDEAAELSEALARQVSAGQIPDPAYSHCPHCGSPEGYLHNPDCTTMRRGKSRLGKTLAEIRAAQAAQEEPAAAMDDDSPRMQAIGQNGNDGEHYDDPWAGAPEWAKYKAQDADGEWRWYAGRPVAQVKLGYWTVSKGRIDVDRYDEPNPNWRDTRITRT